MPGLRAGDIPDQIVGLIVITWNRVMFKVNDISDDGDSGDSNDRASHLVCSQGSQLVRVWSPVETRLTGAVLDCHLPDIIIMIKIIIMVVMMVI